VLVISIAVALASGGMALVGPILPSYASSFGLPLTAVGFFISLNSASAMLLAVPLGALADRKSRKLVLLGGMTLLALGAFLLNMAKITPLLFAAQILLGAGTAGVTTTGMSQMLDLTDSTNRSKVVGLYMLFLQIPAIAGSVFGGQLAYQYGTRTVCLFYASLAMLGGLFALAFVKEEKTKVLPTSLRDDSTAVSAGLIGKDIRRSLSIVYLIQFGYMLCFQGLVGAVIPLFVSSLGFDSRITGLLFSIIGLSVAVCLFPSGILADFLGRREVLIPTAIVGGIGLILLRVATTVPILILGVTLMGISCGLGIPIPATLLGDLAPAEARGKVMGLYRSLGQLGLTLSAIAFGFVGQFLGLANTFLVALAIWFTITAAMFILPRGKPGHMPSPFVKKEEVFSEDVDIFTRQRKRTQ
jgi:MFS family permease